MPLESSGLRGTQMPDNALLKRIKFKFYTKKLFEMVCS